MIAGLHKGLHPADCNCKDCAMNNKVKRNMSAWEMILGLKDPDEMFDLAMVGAYMAGQLDGMMPVDESRKVFEAIKHRLSKVRPLNNKVEGV